MKYQPDRPAEEEFNALRILSYATVVFLVVSVILISVGHLIPGGIVLLLSGIMSFIGLRRTKRVADRLSAQQGDS